MHIIASAGRFILWLVAGSLLLFLIAALVSGIYGSQRIIRRRIPDEEDSPANYGLDYEEVEFRARDGLLLRGWFIPAPQAKGTVIFCHGHAGSMDPDIKYVPHFHSRGYNVLMFDFRGHGRSEGNRVSMGYYERLDLLGALAYLKGRGIEKVGVLGFSMGGAVAITTAAQEPSIKAVVCDGAFPRLAGVLIRGSREHYPALAPLSTLMGYASLLVASLRLRAWLPYADPIRWVGRISPRPLLLIHGEDDPYISVEDVKELYQAAGEPKELWVAPRAGHRQVDEVYPEEYREKVLAFFDKWLQEPGGER